MIQRRRRAIGAGLTAYGLTGLIVGVLVLAATIAVGVGMQPALASVDRQRDAIVASLEHGASSLEKTAALIDDASGAVQNASSITSQAADVSRRFADTLTRLADTFGSFDILGKQPFGPLASDATQLAAQLRGIATDLDALGIRLGSIGRGLPPLAEDIAATSTDLARVASELAALEVPDSAASAFGWLVVGVILLVAWLLVPAVAALVVGVALLRGPPAAAP
jgi:methyl-accepting chemotaxis protein